MKFNNTKKIMAIILAAVMVCATFVGCSKNKDEDVNAETSSNTSENVSKEDETETSTEAQTEASTEAATQKEITTQKPETTTKKQVTTTKKTETTTKKKPAQTTTKPAPKPTTTKPQTTVKHVGAKEVQKQVNDYIRSKGITVDTSMTPDNSSWTTDVSILQEYLDDGTTLRNAKGGVDWLIEQLLHGQKPDRAYAYLGDDGLYILYM